MIPFDFEYYRPDTLHDAVNLFQNLDNQGKKPVYYGGGTEIISMARMNNFSTGAVIDIKEIPECIRMDFEDDQLVIGAAVTLTQVHEANYFPLLSLAGARVADHTIQNKITLGGNLCGSIVYHEAVLPLLLAESSVWAVGPEGERQIPILQGFGERMQLKKGELMIQVRTPASYLSCPHIHVKRTKEDKINYPLVTLCAMQVDGQVRVAFSSLCAFPFRSLSMEGILNDRSRQVSDRTALAIADVPAPIADNLEGSAAYRAFVAKHLLADVINTWEASHQ